MPEVLKRISTIDELVERLREIERDFDDGEVSHLEADRSLLSYIQDSRVTDAFNDVTRFYS